jgi:hypothetical protein
MLILCFGLQWTACTSLKPFAQKPVSFWTGKIRVFRQRATLQSSADSQCVCVGFWPSGSGGEALLRVCEDFIGYSLYWLLTLLATYCIGYSLYWLLTLLATHFIGYSPYWLLTLLTTHFIVYSLYWLFTVLATHFIVYSLYCLLTLLATHCIVYSLYWLFTVLATHFIDYSLYWLLTVLATYSLTVFSRHFPQRTIVPSPK